MVQVDTNDQNLKKSIVQSQVISLCKSPTASGLLKQIGEELECGRSIATEVLSGGLTNYSYKITVTGHPTIELYAKLTFERAMWNPDSGQACNLERTVSEFNIMEIYAKHNPDLVAKPLACVDVDFDLNKMKLLISEWCPNDEQFANQLIDGFVDERVISKISEALATLHNLDFDPLFNEELRPFLLTAFDLFRAKVNIDAEPPKDQEANRTEKLCQGLGKDLLNTIVDNNIESFHERDCLIHNDYHPFNVIVERKPCTSSLEKFGESGLVTIVDWEMALAGPAGRDLGHMQAFPIACAITHAINGNQDLALNMIEFNNKFWDMYVEAMHRRGKSDSTYIAKVYRDSVGYLGRMAYLGYYSLGAHLDHLPHDNSSFSDLEYIRDALGVMGIKCLSLAFNEENKHVSHEDLRSTVQVLLQTEIQSALRLHNGISVGRRSSTLRALGRQISDSALTFPESIRRSISQSGRGSSIRMSVYLKEILLEDGE